MASLLVCSVLAVGQAIPDQASEPTQPVNDIDRAEETVRRAQAEAERYKIVRDDAAKTVLELRDKPILKWSNPKDGALFGSVVLWTSEGRPQAVASIYRWYVDRKKSHAEFASLSPQALSATRGGESVWTPPAEVQFRDLAGQAAPAESEARRLSQMKEIARRFSATLAPPEEGNTSLRLLTQPLYRYEKKPADVLDGALFAFVQGTDPELLLLIEAEKTSEGARWKYATARLNMFELRLELDGQEVWQVDRIRWPEATSGRGAYAVMELDY